MPRALIALITAAALLAAPAVALGQSAGDEQYTDPFQGGDGGGQEQPAQQPEQPAQQPEQPAAPPEQPAAPAPTPTEPAPGGNGTAEAATPAEAAPTSQATQDGAPTLPRTGLPVLVLAAIGYALLLAGIAIRRKA
jgi:hypothetical protein